MDGGDCAPSSPVVRGRVSPPPRGGIKWTVCLIPDSFQGVPFQAKNSDGVMPRNRTEPRNVLNLGVALVVTPRSALVVAATGEAPESATVLGSSCCSSERAAS